MMMKVLGKGKTPGSLISVINTDTYYGVEIMIKIKNSVMDQTSIDCRVNKADFIENSFGLG